MIFGIYFAVICTYRGFNTTGGAKGVGDATNQGVVQSMVGIIILELLCDKYYSLLLQRREDLLMKTESAVSIKDLKKSFDEGKNLS